MSELGTILDRLVAAARRGVPVVLATVVRVAGSAYRRPGARLLLCPDGERVGLISGGCLEGDVAKKAWWRTEAGPVVVRYDTGGGDDGAWAFGLGCNGVVDVLLERIDPAAPPAFLGFLRGRLTSRRPGVLARVVGGEGGRGAAIGDWLMQDVSGTTSHNFTDHDLATAAAADAADRLRAGGSGPAAYALPNGRVEVAFEVVRPPVSLVVCGAGPDAVPVVALANQLGWHVTVCGPRGPAATRFPLADEVVTAVPADLSADGAAVVMSHNYEDDRRFLRALLASPVGYVGVLGPRRRTDALLGDLAAEGFHPTPDRLARLHAPVGLDLGAETPAEIALAVVAEVRAALNDRAGGFLRDNPGPLHDRGEVPMPTLAGAV